MFQYGLRWAYLSSVKEIVMPVVYSDIEGCTSSKGRNTLCVKPGFVDKAFE